MTYTYTAAVCKRNTQCVASLVLKVSQNQLTSNTQESGHFHNSYSIILISLNNIDQLDVFNNTAVLRETIDPDN